MPLARVTRAPGTTGSRENNVDILVYERWFYACLSIEHCLPSNRQETRADRERTATGVDLQA